MDHTSEFRPQGELYVSEPSHDRLLTSHSPLAAGCAATLFFGGVWVFVSKTPPPSPHSHPHPVHDQIACFSLSPRFFNKTSEGIFFFFCPENAQIS